MLDQDGGFDGEKLSKILPHWTRKIIISGDDNFKDDVTKFCVKSNYDVSIIRYTE